MISGGSWPLTGRDRELRAIRSALGSGGVLLAGAAGVGKTRLATAAVSGRPGVRRLTASESARGIPLAAFAPVLAHAVPDPDGASLLARTHAALRAEPDVLLVVDDAHLLDDVSATLLHQLAAERRVPLLVTVRSGEPAPDAVTALWKDGLLVRLDLGPLTEEQTGALLGAVLSGRLDRDSTRRLHQATAGNVLWLRHLVEAELADGRFQGVDGMWRWTGAPRLTPALGALIEDRVGGLPPEVERVLELLAVGEPLGVALLSRLTGRAEIEEAVGRGLVVAETSGRRFEARLAHPLYGEAVRERCGPVRARRLRGLLAETLAATGARREGDVLRRAVLALDSDLQPDPQLLFAGATRAGALTDLPLAARLGRAACDAGAGFDARLALAFVLGWQFDGMQAEREYAIAAAAVDDPAQRVRVALARTANLFFMLGKPEEADAVLADAERDTPQAAAEIAAMRAVLVGARGELAVAEQIARRTLAVPGVSAPAEAYAAWMLTVALALTGRCTEALAAADRGVAAAVRSPETASLQVNIAYWVVFGLGLAGRPEAARDYTTRLSAALTGRFQELFVTIFDGLHALACGRPGPAAAALVDFRPHLPGSGGGWTALLEANLAQALGMSGDAAAAAQALERGRTWRHPGMEIDEPQLVLGEAWAAAATGAVSAGAASARRAAAVARKSGQSAMEVLARHTAVAMGDRTQAQPLAQLARRVEGPRTLAAAAHARALAGSDPDALLNASAQLEQAGLLLQAAESASQAAVLLRERMHAGAATAAGRAAELAAACTGARTPALVAAARPLPITEREREVATLATALSNREIAERLGISVRTVEGHVYRACTKLGVAGRSELAALVGPPGG